MSYNNECCLPPTSIPGSPGGNAYTNTTANIVVPAVNAIVTVPVIDTSWMQVGQYVILPGPANFQVAAINGQNSVNLTFVDDTGDIAVGSTINLGSLVTPAGQAGLAGTNGLNAYTLLTASLTLPAKGSSVTAAVGSSTQFAIGQNVFISDGDGDIGNFTITGFPSSTSMALTFLDYTGDSAPSTVINANASVVPAGLQGVAGFQGVATIDTALAGTQALSGTPTQALGVALALATGIGHTYLIFCRVAFKYVGATFASTEVITLALTQTNSSPGTITNGTATKGTGIVTTSTSDAGEISVMIPYTTLTAADNIEPYVSVGVSPSAGSLEVFECFLTATQLS